MPTTRRPSARSSGSASPVWAWQQAVSAGSLARNREHDLAELLAAFQPLVRRPRLREREHRVDVHTRAPAADEVVGAEKVLAGAHRRAVDRQLLPPEAMQLCG